MFSKLRAHFRQQFVGYIALFVAMGGTAYAANQWTGADIVDGSLSGADVRGGETRTGVIVDGSLTGADVSDGSLTGADINELSLGQVPNAARAGVRDREVVYAESPDDLSSDEKTAVAICPGGKVPVGGGHDLYSFFPPYSPVDVSVKRSMPFNNNSWVVKARRDTGLNPGAWSLEAYAVCVGG